MTLGAVFLLFLGVENGEDCFIKHRFETFLSQGRAFQVALCSNLKYKRERHERKTERKAPRGQPSARPRAPAAAWTADSLGVLWMGGFKNVLHHAPAILIFKIFMIFIF